MKWHPGIKIALLLIFVAFCLFGVVLQERNGIFRDVQATLFQTQGMLLISLAVWFFLFVFPVFKIDDLPLLGFLVIALTMYFFCNVQPGPAAFTLLVGVTLGKAAFSLVRRGGGSGSEVARLISQREIVLVGLVALLSVASSWHLQTAGNYYHGPRWMGLWSNPNEYGVLMGAGLSLASGLLAKRWKEEGGDQTIVVKAKRCIGFFVATRPAIGNWKGVILLIAVGMMATGLLFSYSRGAWVGTAVGLLYLANVYGKFKWRWVLRAVFVASAVVWFFWNATADTTPWYVARLDFGRGSVQHRLAAWKGGFAIMRDHPFGIGWNRTVETYEKHYSPPEGGASAIATNDYLILGTQLGIPGLICFVAYVVLALRGRPGGRGRRTAVGGQAPENEVDRGWRMDIGKKDDCLPSGKPLSQELVFSRRRSFGLLPRSPVLTGEGFPRRGLSRALRFWKWLRRGLEGGQKSRIGNQKSEISEEERLQAACRAGAVAMAVAFWFDGGLFKLPTAAVFWVLLELGQGRRGGGKERVEDGR